MYMQDYDVLIEKEGIGLPVVYAFAVSTKTEHEKRWITAQTILHEQAKDS